MPEPMGVAMPNQTKLQDRMLRLREALEASWDGRTSYKAAVKPGNPALGQLPNLTGRAALLPANGNHQGNGVDGRK